MYFKNNLAKGAGAAVLSVALISGAFFAPPLQSRAEPTILSVIVGGVAGLFGVDFFSCGFNILFYCDESENVVGSDGGNSVVQNPCTSSANACGQTNTGFLSADGNVCSADAPPNSSCPAPSIGANDFYAQPNIVKEDDTSTLHWTSSNSTSCTISGENGFSHTGGTSGTVSTGPIAKTSVFTLNCQNGDGGPQGSASIKVVVTPKFQEI